ncbi:PAN2-PAN3 deadenylation complex catalytic subunit PAN2 [Trichonephila clavipes]|uniref:PAN2-PAN3 deadenylation complex catalytic subunit PAN2 n=1 Tax=Trichonephila clavipes TaxID=2585209 RepID=A0A8X7BL81_TRICX|nr:PAN2-PAN3 deadenylation complex catalytic subunit PAN2 [Trichonephila clavipes]
MSPISMVFPPLLLRFVPAYSSRLCVVSQTGQFQMVDTNNSDQYASYIHQVETAGADILTFDTSTSCQAFVFGDAAGYMHLYGANNEVQFNQFSRATEFADSVDPVQPIDINDEITPLSIIPLPHCDDKLLSDLPLEFCKVEHRPTPPIDSLILNTMKMVGPIGYAPNPGNRQRNQVPYQLNDSKQLDSPVSRDEDSDLVPYRYLKQEIKYTKMGLDEIDFNRFNRTSFSGLEANLPNSYCNNMIQILYFVEPLRSALLSHLCLREFCLSCELGFLFHMLDTAEGLPCQDGKLSPSLTIEQMKPRFTNSQFCKSGYSFLTKCIPEKLLGVLKRNQLARWMQRQSLFGQLGSLFISMNAAMEWDPLKDNLSSNAKKRVNKLFALELKF